MSKSQREFVLWGGVAVAAVLVLVVILRVQYATTQNRWAIAVTTQPALGSAVFQSKGCAHCHAEPSEIGPSLRQHPASLPQLVSAMWNHAPRMYEAMNQSKLAYPKITYEETGQLVAYLYLTGHSDGPGDPERGKQLFVSKNCARCHASATPGKAPALTKLAHSDSPLAWTQTLWNHAAAMEGSMRREGIAWPRFQADELRDLFAYVRREGGRKDGESLLTSADPDRGWQVFQAKYCINCHDLRNATTEIQTSRVQRPVGPALGPESKLPPTFSQLGEAMLNHYPAMQSAMREVGQGPPVFEREEFADLALFLYTLHYQEPPGSPHVGASVFVWRGCAECHGARGDGTSRGPQLRGRGQTYTAVRLATGLWQHGENMYEESRRSGRSWPTLRETDIGDLLSFLNTPIEQQK